MTTIPELQPRNQAEEYAAALGVRDERKADEGDRLVDGLTDKEKLLIEYAWEAGAEAARQRIAKKLSNPQATMLDAKAVSSEIEAWTATPHLDRHPGYDFIGNHYDKRVVSLVTRARRELEAKAE